MNREQVAGELLKIARELSAGPLQESEEAAKALKGLKDTISTNHQYTKAAEGLIDDALNHLRRYPGWREERADFLLDVVKKLRLMNGNNDTAERMITQMIRKGPL